MSQLDANFADIAACLLMVRSEDCTPFMQSETTNESWNLDSILEWLYLNRVRVGVGVGIVVVLGLGVALTKWRKSQNEANANEAIFALPSALSSTRKKTDPRTADFIKIGEEYSGTLAGERAALIAAGLLFSEGKYVESHQQFSKFLESHEGSPLLAQAALGVAASLEAQGKIPEATVKYQEAITKYSTENIVAPGKLTLARLQEAQGKPAEALKLYDDLVRAGNPYDPWSAEASERKEELLRKFPDLKPKPVVAQPTVPVAAPLLATNAPAPATNPAPVK